MVHDRNIGSQLTGIAPMIFITALAMTDHRIPCDAVVSAG